MTKKLFFFPAAVFLLNAFFARTAAAQPRFSSQGHKGKVVAAFLDSASKSGAFYTVGADGFVIRWENGIGERFQVSDKTIYLASPSPGGKEIAFYENDGAVYHSVKVWDAAAKKAKRSLLFKERVTSLSYSAKGTYLVATTNERNGVHFFLSSSGKPFSKIKDFGVTASWAKTSESEKNVLLYSALEGSVSYFSLKTGKLLKKVPAEAGLENPVLFARNNFLAGTKGGVLNIVSAESGAKIKSVPAKSPLIIEGSAKGQDDGGQSQALRYVDGAGGLYSVYKIEVGQSGLAGPLIEKNITARGQKNFSAAFLDAGQIILGADDGNVYRASAEENALPAALELVSNEVYQKIHGICSDGKSLYILTDRFVIKGGYEEKAVSYFENSRGWTKIDCAFGKLILRSDSRKNEAYAMDLRNGAEEFLFSAQSRIKKVKAAVVDGQEGVLMIENSRVNFYSFKSGQARELYAGSGIQDAAVIDGSRLAVAKTASSNPRSPLVLASLKTRETVPVKMDGDIATTLEESGGYLFGLVLRSSGEGYSTSAFCMGTRALAIKELAASAQEESESFIAAEFPLVWTNVGSKSVAVINAKTLKKYSLKSGSAFAAEVAKCGGRIATLNEDSSVSWYNVEQPIALAQWFIDSKSRVVEF